MQPMPMTMLRSATETVVPTTCSMIVVSTVIAGDLGRAVLLEEAGRQAQQVAVHREADVGDDALAEPGDEIEAARGGERQHDDEHQQIFEPAGDLAGVAARGEAAVDDQLEGVGDAERRGGGDQQRERGGGDMRRDSGGAKLQTMREARRGCAWALVVGGAGHRRAA